MLWKPSFVTLAVTLALALPAARAQTPAVLISPSKTNPQNLLAAAARSVGATQCLAAIERLSALAIRGAHNHEVLVDWDRKNPKAAPLFSLIAIVFPDSVAATSITAVPQPGGECTIAVERISLAPYTCNSVAQVELKGYQASALLPTFTVYTSAADPGASVSLIDSPPSCMVIRRHVQYGWRDAVAPTAGPR